MRSIMKKLHKLSCGVIAILMAMHQVQAESDFDPIKRLRPETFSDFDEERWLYYGKDHRIFNAAGTQIKLKKVKEKTGDIAPTALLLLSPDKILTQASTDINKRKLLSAVDSHDLNYAEYRNFAADFKLNAFGIRLKPPPIACRRRICR
ncbi:hypothetical protein NVIRENTERO_00947 [Sodalis praecaptivus]|nr:hypothetical protein NVIRENTERO_00947 [Sodalis praecaptivus]